MRKLFLSCLLLGSSVLFADIISITKAEELSALKAKGIVVVDFYADWCGPCKKISPILDKLSNQKNDVQFAKVNSDHSSLGKELGVSGLPTVIIYVDGKEANRFVGYKDESFITNFINNASK